MNQRTITEPVEFEGMGILFGKRSKIRLSPAPPNTGIVFNEKIRAVKENSFIFRHSLGLKEGKTKIYFTEHFLATCFGLGINNLFINLSGKELPFGDGSALPFLKLFNRVEIKVQRAQSKIYNLTAPVIVSQSAQDKFILAVPAKMLTIEYFINFPRIPPIQAQFFAKPINTTNFRKELAKARTFGYYSNLRLLKEILTFELQSYDGFILPKLPRAKNEPVSHKVLDLLGHLALLNYRLNAKVFAFQPSHKLNQEFINCLGI